MPEAMTLANPAEKNSRPQRLGVFGGTFDPPHIGHMLIAQAAIEALGLDEVVFVPSGCPPHKNVRAVTPADHRLSMIRLATADHPQFSVDDLELNATGKTYTIDTMHALNTKRPGAQLFFLMGADSLIELSTWMRIHELLPLCRFITFLRPGESTSEMTKQVAKLPEPWASQILRDLQVGHEINISSTKIRQRVLSKQSIRYLVPAEIEAYIRQHGLYTT